MIEQTGMGIIQVFDMHQYLMDGFVDPLLFLIFLSHFVQKQHRHKQCINPHFTFV